MYSIFFIEKNQQTLCYCVIVNLDGWFNVPIITRYFFDNIDKYGKLGDGFFEEIKY